MICGIVCGNNPLIYTDPSGYFRLNLGRFFRNVEHAVAQNWRVIASVAISAVAFYAAGDLIVMENAAYAAAAGEESFFTGVPSAAIINYVGPGSVAAIHAGAGAIAGGLSSAINHGSIGLGMLTGGMSAGVASYAGSFMANVDWGTQFVGRTAVGSVTGGVTTSVYGGNFWKGFVQGAETSAAEFIFNKMIHDPNSPIKVGKFLACSLTSVVGESAFKAGEHFLLNKFLPGILHHFEFGNVAEFTVKQATQKGNAYHDFEEGYKTWGERLGKEMDACVDFADGD